MILACDKRISDPDAPVDLAYSEDDVITLTPTATADFPTLCEFAVPQKDGSCVTMIDYISAGQTYDERSLYACWIPTKR